MKEKQCVNIFLFGGKSEILWKWISQSHYISNCRKQFSTYLCRPDHKQEFISQWQEYYNGLDVSLRHEEVMKSELHHRVDVSEIPHTEMTRLSQPCDKVVTTMSTLTRL